MKEYLQEDCEFVIKRLFVHLPDDKQKLMTSFLIKLYLATVYFPDVKHIQETCNITEEEANKFYNLYRKELFIMVGRLISFYVNESISNKRFNIENYYKIKFQNENNQNTK